MIPTGKYLICEEWLYYEPETVKEMRNEISQENVQKGIQEELSKGCRKNAQEEHVGPDEGRHQTLSWWRASSP